MRGPNESINGSKASYLLEIVDSCRKTNPPSLVKRKTGGLDFNFAVSFFLDLPGVAA
jgi:hypothetical protein